MTPGQLIDLLEKAGMLKEESPGVLGWHPTMQKAERFSALLRDYLLSTEIHSCHANCERFACVQTRRAVEAEREACAKVCEEKATGYEERAAQPKDFRDINPEVARIAVLACGQLAAAIRARGQA